MLSFCFTFYTFSEVSYSRYVSKAKFLSHQEIVALDDLDAILRCFVVDQLNVPEDFSGHSLVVLIVCLKEYIVVNS